MHPNLNFYWFEVSSYAFFMAVALIVVFVGSYLYSLRRGFDRRDALWMLVGMSLAVFVGARLFNVIINFDWYYEDFSRIYAFNAGGFSLYGGALFAILAGVGISYWRGVKVYKFGDTVIPFVGIGIAVMRVGCFLNGCCFGKETHLPWGVKFPEMSPAHIHQISHNLLGSVSVASVHPTQIYELVAALIGVALSFYIIKKNKPAGSAFFAFVIWFSVFRWVNMYLRELPYSEMVVSDFYPGFYAVIILLGGGFIFINSLTPQKSSP